ncbi:MAG: DoxX family protein [Rhodobacterales bacterium]|nr:DoxX family protein [Rhodobacterales bacterium]
MTNAVHAGPQTTEGGLAGLANGVLSRLEALPNDIVAVLARVGLAGIFFKSGLTKVVWDSEDGLMFADSVEYLFEEEYGLPLLPWDVAATLATFNELVMPVLLVLGLLTRGAALVLLGMTVVIQLFVYSNLWETHALWAAGCLFLILRGPGVFSLDHLIRRRVTG